MSIRIRLFLLPEIGNLALLFFTAAAQLRTAPAQPARTNRAGGAKHHALVVGFACFPGVMP
jgi:hypothetical protein